MRVWDIHPGYLSRQNLFGQHAEIHALANIIGGEKKGYAAHPETRRWKGKLNCLKRRHDLNVLEIKLRSYNHASPLAACRDNDPAPALVYVDTPVEQINILKQKYRERNRAGRIPLPKNAFEFWAHHKYSVMARGYNHYKDIQAHLRLKERCPLEEEGHLIGQILEIMGKPVFVPALTNVVDHLWGYFKKEASEAEKETYLKLKSEQLPALVPFIYGLARKYNCSYLLHSTIFADFTDQY